MALVGATSLGSSTRASGRGVVVGVIDSGVDTDHPDIVPNLDLARSCSFITTGTPTADPQEVANGDCSNKVAVEYLSFCGSDAEQRDILQRLRSAAMHAQQRGVLVVAAAGNQQMDLQHPGLDAISPDWPPGSAVTRDVQNNCRVAGGAARRAGSLCG